MARAESNILKDKSEIIDYVLSISNEMVTYIRNHSNSTYCLLYKYITHSDLPAFGKATSVDSLEDNLLYYISIEEMKNVMNRTKKPFPTAHQSNIGLRKEFYEIMEIPDPREVDQYLVNDYMNVYLVNSTIKYFNYSYTSRVFGILDKHISISKQREWSSETCNVKLGNVKLSNSDIEFTPIQLHIARHGIGISEDEDFRRLRHNIFNGDIFVLLYEIDFKTGTKNLFILLEKNPLFYSLTSEIDFGYVDFQRRLSEQNKISVTDTVTRRQQSAWKDMLAHEMMGYTMIPNQVFCPFTYITADYEDLHSLFVASHIKGFSDENTTDEEKYDINNGLLLSANANALFDKHLIAVDKNKELVFSCLLDKDYALKQQLLLLNPIFRPILNKKRMEYLAYHKSIFDELEKKRKK